MATEQDIDTLIPRKAIATGFLSAVAATIPELTWGVLWLVGYPIQFGSLAAAILTLSFALAMGLWY